MSKATVEKKKTESLIRKIKSGKYNETMSFNGKNSTNTEVKRIQLISNNTNEILNNIDIIEKATKNLEETAELEREKMLKPKKRINSQIFEMKTRENEQISNHAQKFSIQILNKGCKRFDSYMSINETDFRRIICNRINLENLKDKRSNEKKKCIGENKKEFCNICCSHFGKRVNNNSNSCLNSCTT